MTILDSTAGASVQENEFVCMSIHSRCMIKKECMYILRMWHSTVCIRVHTPMETMNHFLLSTCACASCIAGFRYRSTFLRVYRRTVLKKGREQICAPSVNLSAQNFGPTNQCKCTSFLEVYKHHLNVDPQIFRANGCEFLSICAQSRWEMRDVFS